MEKTRKGSIANIYFDANWPGDGNPGSGSLPPDKPFWYGPFQFPSVNLSKSGYTPIGWDVNPQATTPLFAFDQDIFVDDFEQEYGISGEDITLYLIWQSTAPTYKVSYSGNGASGGSVPSDSNSYSQGASVTVKANTGSLVKSGYNFVGWATTSSASTPTFAVTGSNVNPPNFNMPTSNVTLYAVWQVPQATVTYNGNGQTSGSAPTDTNSPYVSGAVVTVLGNTGNLVRTGYRFLGWNTSQSATTAQYTAGNTFTITQNTTLYAIWKQTFTLTYNGNGNTSGSAPNDNSSPYDTGSTVTVLGNTNNLVKTDHTFLGWSTSNSATSAQYTQGSTFTITQNTTLYAVWQPNSSPTYKVTYNGNNNTGGSVPTDNNNYVNGATVTVAVNSGNLVRTNYAFKGWATTNNASTPTYTVSGSTVTPPTFTMGNANVTLYAVWKPTYSVTYNANRPSGSSGAGSLPSTARYEQGATVSVATNSGNLTTTGYVFKGWATTNNASSPTYTVSGSTVTPSTFVMGAVNITLYAVWKPTYSVIYDVNRPVGVSGTGTVPSVVLYEQGDVVFVAINSGNLTAVGYVFKGWGSTSNATVPTYVVSGSTVNPPSFSMSASNITLYAVWQPTGGGGFDGGTINNPLEIKCKFLSLPKVWTDVFNWMTDPATNPSDYSAFLRFTNVNSPLNLSTDIYGVTLKDTSNTPFAAIGINDSLLVRKNFFAQFGSIGELSVPTKLGVNIIESFTDQPIKVKTKPIPNETDRHIEFEALRFSMASTPTQYDDFNVLRIGKGGLQFIDSGGVLTVIPSTTSYHTALGTLPNYNSPEYHPQTSVVNLFCTKVNPAFRVPTGVDNDPVLMVDKAFYVEKDFNTHGFVGTVSDPHKGSGGAAILMGQGFMGAYCPPWFSLLGLLGYPFGPSFPSSDKTFKNQWFYKTESEQGFPKGLYRYFNQGTPNDPNYQWTLKVQCNHFGSYPSGTTLPNNPDEGQYFYKANDKELWQYADSVDNPVFSWKKRFNWVQSPEYDTLFLVRGEENPDNSQILANLHLGSLTATDTIYVDQIKHLNGNDWSFSDNGGGGGFNKVQAGQAWTNGDKNDPHLGEATIFFPTAYDHPPIVTVSIMDLPLPNPSNRLNLPMIAKIIDIQNDRFTVKTWYIHTPPHKHKIAHIGQQIPGITPPWLRTIKFADVGGNVNDGGTGMLVSASGSSYNLDSRDTSLCFIG